MRICCELKEVHCQWKPKSYSLSSMLLCLLLVEGAPFKGRRSMEVGNGGARSFATFSQAESAHLKTAAFFFFFLTAASGTECITKTSTFKELYCNSRDNKATKSQCWFSSFCLCIFTKYFMTYWILFILEVSLIQCSVIANMTWDERLAFFFPFLAIHCACTSWPLSIIQALDRGGELSWATCKHSWLIFPVLPKGREVLTS